MAVNGFLAAGGDRGARIALPANVVIDVGRVDEGGAPLGAVVATRAAGVPGPAVAGAPEVESSGEGSIVVLEDLKGTGGARTTGRSFAADNVTRLGSTGSVGIEDPLNPCVSNACSRRSTGVCSRDIGGCCCRLVGWGGGRSRCSHTARLTSLVLIISCRAALAARLTTLVLIFPTRAGGTAR
jgi:hypothetical protein